MRNTFLVPLILAKTKENSLKIKKKFGNFEIGLNKAANSFKKIQECSKVSTEAETVKKELLKRFLGLIATYWIIFEKNARPLSYNLYSRF